MGKKKLLKLKDVKWVAVPAYDELKVENFYQTVLEQNRIQKRFPSQYAKGRQCAKKYFFNQWNTANEAEC